MRKQEKKYSVVLTEEVHIQFRNHLIRSDGQEDLCFATYNECSGSERFTAIIDKIILPEDGDREVHGNVTFLPHYFDRAKKIAQDRNQGLVFLHSHPYPGWQNMSSDDITAEKKISPIVYGNTRKHLLGMTISSDEKWSARFWLKDKKKKRKFNRAWCESVRILGNRLTITHNENMYKEKLNKKTHIRTISAWGEKNQNNLARLRICIVGLGSVGSLVAEILARTGLAHFTLIDFDKVEEKNLDRLVNVFKRDIGKFKVDVIKKGIKKSSSLKDVVINTSKYSICEEEGFRDALNCDVIFSCVDRPWPREVLNFISYAYLIPVIDGGIKVITNNDNSKIINAYWKFHTVGCNRTCLLCHQQYLTEMSSLEREGKLDDQTYIQGLPKNFKLDSGENVYSFSNNLASFEVFELLALLGISNIKNMEYNFKAGVLSNSDKNSCHENCYYPTITGNGDKEKDEVNFCRRHILAEKSRNN